MTKGDVSNVVKKATLHTNVLVTQIEEDPLLHHALVHRKEAEVDQDPEVQEDHNHDNNLL